MSAHQSGCKAKCDKEHAKHEGPMKAPKKKKTSWDKWRHSSHMVQMLPNSHKEKKVTLHLLSSQASEHKLVHFLNHSKLLHIHFEQAFSQSDELSLPLFIKQWCLCQTIINHFFLVSFLLFFTYILTKTF